jgi:6-phosphogluconolactonase
MKNLFTVLFAFVISVAWSQSDNTYLFVGTYTDGKPDKGIYVYKFDSNTGRLKRVSNGENITNPSFLTISSNGQFIYACTDTKLPNAGSVSAFRFDSLTGSVTFINKQSSGGENPVYLSSTQNNDFVINANYTGGTASVFKANPDGSLNPYTQVVQFDGSSINKRRQERPHIHAAVFSPGDRYVFLPDLGADKIRIFQFNKQDPKPLKPMEDSDFSTVPGSGPRHFTFHPNKKFAYCIEELSGTISVLRYERGKLDSIQRIFSYSKVHDEYSGADIHVSPDGLFLYASNRLQTENTIAIFSIDQLTGKLELVGHQSTYGEHPRNFTIDPTGNFLIVANQFTNNIVVFKRNARTGLLTRTGEDVSVSQPSCLKMRKYTIKNASQD